VFLFGQAKSRTLKLIAKGIAVAVGHRLLVARMAIAPGRPAIKSYYMEIQLMKTSVGSKIMPPVVVVSVIQGVLKTPAESV